MDGRLPLPDAAARQEERLRARARELDGAIRFCGELQQSGDTAATLDVDACLTRMDSSAGRGWFTGWVNDYRAIARAGRRILRPGGKLYFEIYERSAGQMRLLLGEEGYTDTEVREDLNGKPRMVCSRMN